MWIWNVYGKMQDGEKLKPSEEAILGSVLNNTPTTQRDKAIIERDLYRYESLYGKMRNETGDEMYPEEKEARETDKLVRLTMIGVFTALISLFGIAPPIINQTREYERQTQENLRYLGIDFIIRKEIHREDPIARLKGLENLAENTLNHAVQARIAGNEDIARGYFLRAKEITDLIEKEHKTK